MKHALFALALSLSVSFLLSSCGDNAAKERARIEGEIELVRDSMRVTADSMSFYEAQVMPSASRAERKLFRVREKLANDTNSRYGIFKSRNEIYRSRLDSLNRKLQELPDK